MTAASFAKVAEHWFSCCIVMLYSTKPDFVSLSSLRVFAFFSGFWHLLTSSDIFWPSYSISQTECINDSIYIYTHVIHILHMQDYPCMKHIETWCNDSQILSVSYRFISFGINRYKQSSSAWMRLRIPRAKKKKQRRMAWRRDMNMILVTYLVISVEW